jgi:CRISPR-associated endonuclease/helicase Cas3
MAHTPPREGGGWQPLSDHLTGTARFASSFGAAPGIAELARLAALLHDIGKCSPAFQRYLRECHAAAQAGRPAPRSRVDHKAAGALTAAEITSAPAMVILGHHGGLSCPSVVNNALKTAQTNSDTRQALDNARALLADYHLPTAAQLTREIQDIAASELELDLLLRMLYSCLVDADALDTQRHFDPADFAHRQQTLDLSAMRQRLDDEQARLMEQADATPVNLVRREVYEDCLRAADLPPGVFKLTVPTGGGKTRSSLAFALRHAERHGLQRVIYAIPYTSIIEQIAAVFHGIFPDPYAVLEHHSAVVDLPDEDNDGPDDINLWRRLAAETWDAPLIVTTTVQLFESLFAARPSRCRKVHRLAKCVIILDEVQTLPETLLAPILSALSTLVTRYGSTVVLCTATQPALTGENPYLPALPAAREIIHEPKRHFDALRRVEYRIEAEPWTWEQAAGEMRRHQQCLVVLNRKKDALALLAALDDTEALHLSTLLCGAHRRAVLAEVRERLASGRPCRLVSTQVVEAGVDLDFPCVMRAAGPLDRVVQAAGRCNREGRRKNGEVIVFTPAEGGTPRGPYATACAHAAQMLCDPLLDLHDPAVFDRYFSALYGDLNTDVKEIQYDRRFLRFDAVAEKFRMIDDDTVAVLVPYDPPAVESLIASVRATGHVSRERWQQAQQHSVSLYRREFERFQREGYIVEVLPDAGLYRWLGRYDCVRGIDTATDTADLIV